MGPECGVNSVGGQKIVTCEMLRVTVKRINILHHLLELGVCEVLLFSDYDFVVDCLWCWCQRGIEIRNNKEITGDKFGLGAKARYFYNFVDKIGMRITLNRKKEKEKVEHFVSCFILFSFL